MLIIDISIALLFLTALATHQRKGSSSPTPQRRLPPHQGEITVNAVRESCQGGLLVGSIVFSANVAVLSYLLKGTMAGRISPLELQALITSAVTQAWIALSLMAGAWKLFRMPHHRMRMPLPGETPPVASAIQFLALIAAAFRSLVFLIICVFEQTQASRGVL